MRKSKNSNRHRRQDHSARQNIPPAYGSEQYKMANELLDSHQHAIDMILDGRKEGGFRLNDLWNGWYNNLMIICFTLGGAILAIAPSMDARTTSSKALFWIGVMLLISDGTYMLLNRKVAYERDSTAMITLGYEEEYWSLRAKNCILDYLMTGDFPAERRRDYQEAKEKLVGISNSRLKESQLEANRVDYRVDASAITFLAGLYFFMLSALPDRTWQVTLLVLGLVILVCVILRIKRITKPLKDAISERSQLQKKIAQERRSSEERLAEL